MKPTYILGDHHGDYGAVLSILRERNIRDATIIHVGVGGEGFPDWRPTTAGNLDRHFAAVGIEYLSIRGNHSDPGFFDGKVMLPNFKLLPDYTTLQMNGQSWLLVGGAISNLVSGAFPRTHRKSLPGLPHPYSRLQRADSSPNA